MTRDLPLNFNETKETILDKYLIQWEKDLEPITDTFSEVRFDRATLHGLLISNTYDADQTEYWKRTKWFDDYGELSQLLLINELLLIIRVMLRPGGTLSLPLGYLAPANRDILKRCFTTARKFTEDQEDELGITATIETGQYRLDQQWTSLVGYVSANNKKVVADQD
jgi:hypothetical protein